MLLQFQKLLGLAKISGRMPETVNIRSLCYRPSLCKRQTFKNLFPTLPFAIVGEPLLLMKPTLQMSGVPIFGLYIKIFGPFVHVDQSIGPWLHCLQASSPEGNIMT